MPTFANINCPKCGTKGAVKLLPWKVREEETGVFDGISARCDADCGFFGFWPLCDFIDFAAAIEEAGRMLLKERRALEPGSED